MTTTAESGTERDGREVRIVVKVDGRRLRSARERQLLTLRALGAKSGVQFHTIQAIETGKQEPRPSTLRKLCDALGIAPTDVLAAEVGGAESDGTGTGKAAA